eukprot:TRINITY_DN2386_c0_g1_i5.p1 TRINITY_DN2386_c0_g1~~TRINITY_DN2386_c0_g1_i5.p1  ORF type:complete len:157 (-),score=21.24 TRINITY_DN2386_c0_g1_i5:180-650(-)
MEDLLDYDALVEEMANLQAVREMTEALEANSRLISKQRRTKRLIPAKEKKSISREASPAKTAASASPLKGDESVEGTRVSLFPTIEHDLSFSKADSNFEITTEKETTQHSQQKSLFERLLRKQYPSSVVNYRHSRRSAPFDYRHFQSICQEIPTLD